jgi:hypothetical protein
MTSQLALFLALLLLVVHPIRNNPAEPEPLSRSTETILGAESGLTPKVASHFAELALRCVAREYPNKPDHVLNSEKDVLSPKALHPAFYGCFDWHSSVHGHWMLIRLLRMFPGLPEAPRIRAVLGSNLTAANVSAEVTYMDQPNRKSFERTYGWAWLLKLAQELSDWNDPQGRQWAENLRPLTRAIAARYMDFLPRQTYPIRTGVHPNTAFGIAFALDYARAVHDRKLEKLLVERAVAYYGDDRDAPESWEPGGEDFFSPALMEADLMRRVLNKSRFERWFRNFMPGMGKGTTTNLLRPAIVSDRSDPKIVHLDGLNLSRAWCMIGIAESLPAGDATRERLKKAAELHSAASLAHIASGNYEGEHWLASFAVYLLSQSSVQAK